MKNVLKLTELSKFNKNLKNPKNVSEHKFGLFPLLEIKILYVKKYVALFGFAVYFVLKCLKIFEITKVILRVHPKKLKKKGILFNMLMIIGLIIFCICPKYWKDRSTEISSYFSTSL